MVDRMTRIAFVLFVGLGIAISIAFGAPSPAVASPGVTVSGVLVNGAGVPVPGVQYTLDLKSTRLNSSHIPLSRMPSSA